MIHSPYKEKKLLPQQNTMELYNLNHHPDHAIFYTFYITTKPFFCKENFLIKHRQFSRKISENPK